MLPTYAGSYRGCGDAVVIQEARPGRPWAWAALLVGSASALISVAWGLGSTWALSTVGGALEREGRAGNPTLAVIVWISVLLKLAAAGLGPAVTGRPSPPRRLLVVAAWTAAVVLTLYGGVLTLGGLLVQADVLHASQGANHRALFWHTYLWDPWFLIWGLLLATALVRGGPQRAKIGSRRA